MWPGLQLKTKIHSKLPIFLRGSAPVMCNDRLWGPYACFDGIIKITVIIVIILSDLCGSWPGIKVPWTTWGGQQVDQLLGPHLFPSQWIFIGFSSWSSWRFIHSIRPFVHWVQLLELEFAAFLYLNQAFHAILFHNCIRICIEFSFLLFSS